MTYHPDPWRRPKKRTGLVVGLVVAVLVIGGVVTLGFVLADNPPRVAGVASQQVPPTVGGSGKPTARDLVNALVTAYNAGDRPQVLALHCPSAAGGVDPQPGETLKAEGQVTESGDTATVDISVTTATGRTLGTLVLSKQTAGWCLTGARRR